ncbi:hypothetical protein [Nocardia vaccinii]|uniref:hypothetical protein n=1 Tax=Nocardia vaccinii TaxID=1822 RepID=UPI00083732FB|nr:hypothetical protein [Nocardia vaccinii]
MNNSPNLRRIRRVAAGISVAASLAVAGLTVETAWEEGAFNPRSTEAAGISRTAPFIAPATVALANTVVPQQLSQSSTVGEQTAPPSWTPTPPVRNTHRPPHATTAGS